MKNLLFIIISMVLFSCKKEKNDVLIQPDLFCYQCNIGKWYMDNEDTIVSFNIIEINQISSFVEFPITIPLEFKKDTVEYRTVIYPSYDSRLDKIDSVVLYNDSHYPRFVINKNEIFIEDWRNSPDKGKLKILKR